MNSSPALIYEVCRTTETIEFENLAVVGDKREIRGIHEPMSVLIKVVHGYISRIVCNVFYSIC